MKEPITECHHAKGSILHLFHLVCLCPIWNADTKCHRCWNGMRERERNMWSTLLNGHDITRSNVYESNCHHGCHIIVIKCSTAAVQMKPQRECEANTDIYQTITSNNMIENLWARLRKRKKCNSSSGSSHNNSKDNSHQRPPHKSL